MTQEQIQKNAEQYSDKYATDYGLSADKKFGMLLGFKAGANWRINSVWHSYEEAKKADLNKRDLIIVYHPKVDKFFIGTLVLTDYYCTNPETGVSMKTQGVAVKYDKHMVAIFTEGTQWAYLKDLMPEE